MPSLMGVYTRKGKGKRAKRAIILRRGIFLPRAVAVLAHELTHMWIDMYAKGNYPLEEKEGFCDFIAFKILEKLGFPPYFAERHGIFKKQLLRYLKINQFMSVESMIKSFAGGRQCFIDDVKRAKKSYFGGINAQF